MTMTIDVDTRHRTGALLLATLLLAGCASTGQHQTSKAEAPTLDQIRGALQEGAKSNEQKAGQQPPADVQQALMPKVEPRTSTSQASEQRFDLNVHDAPARAFFMGLVDGTPYNMVVHPDVKGKISLDLKDVTVPEVMDIVRRVYGYEYERRDDGYIVMPARLQSRIFHVDYLNVDRTGESNTRVNSGQSTEMNTNNNNNDNNRNNRNNSNGYNNQNRQPSSRIKTKTDADFWGTLKQTVQAIVGPGDGRSVIVDPESGLVVVRAMPNELRDVAQYLHAAQTSLQRQVILEAKILEVRLSGDHQTGINWAALGRGSGGDRAIAGQTALTNGQSNVLTSSGAFDPSSVTGVGGQSGFDFGGLFAIGARTDNFAGLIRLLDTQGDVQVLSSPRVSTLNNQQAVIKVGSDEFFVTDVNTQTNVGGASTLNSQNVQLTPFFSGIALDVTPQIGGDGQVTLHVHPSVSDVRDQTKQFTIGGQQQTLPLAFSTVRESDSVVRASDGQVIVIGGLMQNQSDKQRAQSGGLGDIPILGALFRQKADSNQRSELVILLKPIIADAPSDWAGQMNDVSRRLPDPGDTQGSGQ